MQGSEASQAIKGPNAKIALRELKVLARATPQCKEDLVRALMRNGRKVAVCGEGTNDAPSLAAANIGFA